MSLIFFGRNMDKEEMKARPYQLELLNKAIDENAIIYLGTGAGKTSIATSLIKEKMAGILHENKKTVFLCHRVPLVTQQAKFIKDNTPLTVRSFSGGKIFSSQQSCKLIERLLVSVCVGPLRIKELTELELWVN